MVNPTRFLASVARLLVLGTVACVAASCGGDASSPASPSPLGSLRPGAYWLYLTGIGISIDPTKPLCRNPLIVGGTLVMTLVDLSQTGIEWVARSNSESGADLLIMFSQSSVDVGSVYVHGRASGRAVDMKRYALDRATGVQVVIDDPPGSPAELDGDFGKNSMIGTGTIKGAITFTDRDGRVSTCGDVLWDLIPYGA